MRDEDFDFFISNFGEATERADVPPASLAKFEKKLPDRLLKYWAEEGWSGYANGLFWTVDPEAYEDILDLWLEDTLFEEIDVYHVIARTAFGKLYAWGEKTGPSLTISCPLHALVALERDLKGTVKNPDARIANFFASKTRNECDLKDVSKKSLFDSALHKLKELGPTEMYGFEPALIAGGQMSSDHLKKVDLDVHLTILRQLAAPKLPFLNVPR